MKGNPNVTVAEYDAEGKLVPLENETEEDTLARESVILYATGQSANHPSEVFPDYELGDHPGGDGSTGSGETLTPVIESIEPEEVAIGSDDIFFYVQGQNFTDESVMSFAGHDEPTTLEDDGRLSTIVKPSLWANPDTVKVSIRNGNMTSNEVDFAFTDAEAGGTSSRREREKSKHKRY
jgi:hypothetical protein